MNSMYARGDLHNPSCSDNRDVINYHRCASNMAPAYLCVWAIRYE